MGTKIHAYRSPEEFFSAVEKGEVLLTQSITVVTDYYFGEQSSLNGLDVKNFLDRHAVNCRTVLASSIEGHNLSNKFDKIIGKMQVKPNNV